MGIAVRAKPKISLSLVFNTGISMQMGIEGDYHYKGLIPDTSYDKDWRRQVTLLSHEQWSETCGELGVSHEILPWQVRRANILVGDIRFNEGCVNKILRIGSTVRLQITGETKPCNRMDEVHPGLREALIPGWRGGVTCNIREGGVIKVDDEVRWEPVT
jgi:MOSC domain-containing protein YiiM